MLRKDILEEIGKVLNKKTDIISIWWVGDGIKFINVERGVYRNIILQIREDELHGSWAKV